MWERYCRGVNAIVYMVDAADQDKIEVPCNVIIISILIIIAIMMINGRRVGTSCTTCLSDPSLPEFQFW